MGLAASKIVVNPQEFFRGKVTEASSTLKVYLGDELEFYVVNLLCEFINPEKVNESLGENVLNTPLATMLQKAHEVETEERKIAYLRRLGDASLYVAGYFQDFFTRKTYDVGYYIQMGSMAYGEVSSLQSKRDSRGQRVFQDLSQNFSKIVDVVAEVSDPGENLGHGDILAVYDRWLRSNSDRLRKVLTRLGIQPIHVPTKPQQ